MDLYPSEPPDSPVLTLETVGAALLAFAGLLAAAVAAGWAWWRTPLPAVRGCGRKSCPKPGCPGGAR